MKNHSVTFSSATEMAQESLKEQRFYIKRACSHFDLKKLLVSVASSSSRYQFSVRYDVNSDINIQFESEENSTILFTCSRAFSTFI